MKNKIIIITFFVCFMVVNIISQENISTSIPHEATLDHSKQFWIDSKNVGDKFLIKIYLPESYFRSDKQDYPVIYTTDGDRLFGLASFLVFYQLYREDIDVILVSVGYGSMELNDEKRSRDYAPFPDDEGRIGSEIYLSFLKEELFSKLETEYRIDSSKRTLVGWSRGAMFALDVMFKQPELFKNYVVMSPRIKYPKWSAAKLEEEYFSKRSDLPIRLYCSMGKDDERFSLFPEFVQTIEKRDYDKLKFQWNVFEDKDHDALALSEGLGRALNFIFIREGIDKVLLEIINQQGIENAVEEYNRLLKEEPDGYNFDENKLNILGYQLLSSQKIKEAIEIFKLNVGTYPNSFNVYDSLGEAYMISGNKEPAIENYKKSLELNPGNTNAGNVIKKMKEE